MEIKKVVIIGSGTMGSGIAAHLCNANIPVTLLDLKTEISEKARDRIHKSRPPLLIDKTKKGWKVELNKSTLPAIKIEEGLAEKVKNNIKKNENDKRFVSEAFNSAKWLLRAIEQRNSTTLKVAVEILKKQKEFFKNGPGHLKPLVLRNVASSIGMHESTVSRVTNSKLILTEWGVMPLKNFFSASIAKFLGEISFSTW